MSERSSDDEQIPMADEDEDLNYVQTDREASLDQQLQPDDVMAAKNETQIPATTVVAREVSQQQQRTPSLFDNDLSPEEQEEKARLIAQVLELQNTLDDLSSRVDNVKEENLRLRSENQVLGQYIENLMAASSVFQPANEQPKGKRK